MQALAEQVAAVTAAASLKSGMSFCEAIDDQLFVQFERASAAIESLELRLDQAETARPSDPRLDEVAMLMRGVTKRFEPAE